MHKKKLASLAAIPFGFLGFLGLLLLFSKMGNSDLSAEIGNSERAFQSVDQLLKDKIELQLSVDQLLKDKIELQLSVDQLLKDKTELPAPSTAPNITSTAFSTAPTKTSTSGAMKDKIELQLSWVETRSHDRQRCSANLMNSFGINMRTLHSMDPFENFSPQKYGVVGPDLTGWGLDTEVFGKVLRKQKPKFMVEVGSWKGSSAVYFAQQLRKLHGPEECVQLICVDTWLGTTHAWHNKDMENPKDGNDLHLGNGYPTVYYQFLYNVIHAQADDIIVPFPLPSAMGALYFAQAKIKSVNLIYIDGCHDMECVLQDITLWYPLLSPGGTMLGDDYDRVGVQQAVREFCTKEPGCTLDKQMSSKRTWVMHK